MRFFRVPCTRTSVSRLHTPAHSTLPRAPTFGPQVSHIVCCRTRSPSNCGAHTASQARSHTPALPSGTHPHASRQSKTQCYVRPVWQPTGLEQVRPPLRAAHARQSQQQPTAATHVRQAASYGEVIQSSATSRWTTGDGISSSSMDSCRRRMIARANTDAISFMWSSVPATWRQATR